MLAKIKLLHPNVSLPLKVDEGSSGYDLKSLENYTLSAGKTHLFKLGFSMEMPPRLEAQIRSRSGLSLKHGVIVLNSPGTIDSSYTGEIGVILHNVSSKSYHVEEGERIAQMVFCFLPEVWFQETDTIQETSRGTGGFGSSGRK